MNINKLSDRNLHLIKWDKRESSRSIISKIDVNYVRNIKKKSLKLVIILVYLVFI